MLIVRVFVFARFRAADHELAAEEFLVVQFFDRALCFLDRLHLDESKSFGALVVAIAHHFGVLDVANAVKKLEEIALGCIKGQVADVKTRRIDFDWFRFTRRPRLLWRPLILLLLLTVARL